MSAKTIEHIQQQNFIMYFNLILNNMYIICIKNLKKMFQKRVRVIKSIFMIIILHCDVLDVFNMINIPPFPYRYAFDSYSK